MSTNTPGQPNFRSLFAGQLELLEGEMELDKAALYLAGEEYPELDVDYFLQQLDSLAEEIRRRVPNPDEDRAVIEAINRYLFDEQGFTGNQDNYYNPENSFLNRLLEDRRGIPITLSILYLEVARRLDLVCYGVGLPGHFLVGLEALDLYLDPFNSGQLLSAADCRRLIRDLFGPHLSWRGEFLHPYTKRDILYRMLTNLRAIYLQSQDYSRTASVIERMLLINPTPPSLYKDLAWCHLRLKDYRAATQHLETYLTKSEPSRETAEIRQQLETLQAALEQLD